MLCEVQPWSVSHSSRYLVQALLLCWEMYHWVHTALQNASHLHLEIFPPELSWPIVMRVK